MRLHLKRAGIILSRPQNTVTSSRVHAHKKAIAETRGSLNPGDHCSYADESNSSWMPTRKAMWCPKAHPVMIPTPAQPKKQHGISAVDPHTGQTVVLIRNRERRREITERLAVRLDRHPPGSVDVPGTMPRPTKTARSRRWCVEGRAGWCCFIWRPPVHSSIRSLCAERAHRIDPRVLRPVQSMSGTDALNHRVAPRRNSVNVLSSGQ